MPQVSDILQTLFRFAPVEGKISGDNVGLLIGDSKSEVERILVALDITSEVIEEAISSGAQLIVSHHPVIYKPVGAVTDESVTGLRLLALARGGVAAICMHTNLDAAPEGVNEALARTCGLRDLTLPAVESGTYPDGRQFAICRAGYLERPTPLQEYLGYLKKALKCNGLRYVDAKRPAHHVAVIGGSGDSELDTVYKYGCDTFVTSDVKHSTFLAAKELGINLIDAGHFSTENTVVPVVCELLRGEYPQVKVTISEKCRQPAEFFV